MKKLAYFLLVTLFVFTTACKNDAKNETTDEVVKGEKADEEKKDDSVKIMVPLESKSGSDAKGSVVFEQKNGTVRMIALVSNLEPGEHAIHLHEKADCSSDDGKSTGGHWNPTAQPHGQWGAETGYHKGDIGNFTADSNGNGTLSFITDEWCIGCGDPDKDIVGKAVIVHQGTDDFTSQPSGAAGARISCGGVIQ
jgi:Cu-Zn family superoxide dismutase